ncbi:phosphorylase [Cupriavidus sp. WKF15]|uniref:phosphorylase n=1 Tax=Cupriavidus sp. WKF15 TaxID=3032282 RepID=UPI0023E2ACE1|nr:phosphorylase [Cupriavidus sp. WKF15]WER50203.1 phosphorylase [Cupriavidus sp. WKF15]
MDFEARIAAGPGSEVVVGLRGAALAAAIERSAGECAGILSFGVAGGLDPALAPGAVVIATSVRDESSGQSMPADPAWMRALMRALPQAAAGALVGSDTAVATLADKAALYAASGALAVDMESHIAARMARSHGLPFAACRVVIDPATRAVPPLALAGMGNDGRTDIGAVMAGLLKAPWQLPALMRLGRDASAARASLLAVRRAVDQDFALGNQPAS